MEIKDFIAPLKKMAKSVPAKLGGVACFIIKNGAIISSGVNHNPTGGPMEDEIEITENGEKLRKLITRPEVIHAEVATIQAAKTNQINLTDAIILLTMSPCINCAKAIAQTGVKELYYLYDWWDKAGLQLLQENDIKIVKIKESK
ncbi:MAG: cytidine deaminase [Candidatus Nomurabacteria bacterium]|nr:cytidine deaminase [Candidatus Nomurabacteria bacterium]